MRYEWSNSIPFVDWVATQIPDVGDLGFGNYQALTISGNRPNFFLACVIFSNWRPGQDIQISAAAANARWCHPAALREIFGYAFHHLDLPRCTAVVAASNARSRKLVGGLGWKLEGVQRQAAVDGGDLRFYGMLRRECRWLGEKSHGQGRKRPHAA